MRVKQRTGSRLKLAFLWNPARMAWAAAAVLVITIALPLVLNRQSEPSLTRLAPGNLRSESMLPVSPVGDMPAAPEQLRWTGLPGAIRYEVRILEVDRTELWKAEIGQTSIPIPASVRSMMIPGKTLQWEVRAFANDGRPISSSAFPVAFRIIRAKSK